MSQKVLVFVFVCAVAASTAACAPGGADSLAAPESVAAHGDAIKGSREASTYPEAVLVDMKRGDRVVAACSGSLIAPTVVLTAGHCVHGFDGWEVQAPFAADQTASASKGGILDWKHDGETVNPKLHDVGLVFLSSPIRLDSYPTLASDPLDDGASIVNIGRIRDGVLSNSHLYVSKPLPVKNAASVGFPYDYVADEIIESGDSGGPDMARGTHTIVAVNSGAGGGDEVLARVDLVKSWIDEQMAAQGDSDPCGGLTAAGACSGNKAVWCEDGERKEMDCGSIGDECGFDSDRQYYTCL